MNAQGLEDTIAAISTASGQGAIGIVRLSGDQSLAIADRIFISKSKKKPSQLDNFNVHFGWIVRPGSARGKKGETLDEALIILDEAP